MLREFFSLYISYWQSAEYILGQRKKITTPKPKRSDLMKVLLHTCCAPCSVKCIDELQKANFTPVIYWYNPNIHPYMEYKNRRDTRVKYSEEENLEIILEDEYGLRNFISSVYPDFSDRCAKCYLQRLEKTARFAAENNYDFFSTTLLISPYQNHELICKIANQMAYKYGVEFFYHDFRPYFREGQKLAREKGFYMQKYCGCIFSEEERYLKNNSK